MNKITEAEYLRWRMRFDCEEDIIYSLLNVIDNLLIDNRNQSVAKSAIACNARRLDEIYDIQWGGFFDYSTLFENEKIND